MIEYLFELVNPVTLWFVPITVTIKDSDIRFIRLVQLAGG